MEDRSKKMPPQDRVVFDCKIDLAGLPDETYGVEVLNEKKELMKEVTGDKPLEEHQFRVDYTHGYLYFHPAHNKKTVTIQKYYSRGMLYFPASRVYSIDEHGRIDINNTLQDYIDSIKTWIFQGEYQAGKSYTANNSVYSDGSIYIAKQDVPTNKIPKKNPVYWQPMSSGFLYRGEYDSSEVYYPREIVAYKKGYYACLQETGGSAPDSGTAWQEIVSVDSIYEAWQGTDGNGGLKQEIAKTLERVENTRDAIVQEWEGTENSEGLKQQLEDMLNGIVIEDNLTSTSTTSSLSARQGKVLNDTKADKQTEHGGFAGGEGAKAADGGAVGLGANTDGRGGFAGGAGAFAEHGGSVGMETKTGDGFAGGYQAKTVDADSNAIDAIQLGTGTNSTEKTLQVYDKQLLDAEGHIPDDRMPQLADKQTEWIVATAGTGTAYTATLDPAPESLYIGMQITIIPHVSSSSSSATLNVNGIGAKYFRQRGRTTGTLYSPSVYSFLAAGKPTTLIYDGTYWVMTEYSRANWNDIKDKPETILSAENIIAGDNVTVTTNGNDVTISASGGGSDVNVVDNLISTSTTSALSANQGKILDEKKADKQTIGGGFIAGVGANTDSSIEWSSGGAIGKSAYAENGGAVGKNAHTSAGGAIGTNAQADNGGAVGEDAKVIANGGAVGYDTSTCGGGAVGSSAHSGYGFAGGYFANTEEGGAAGNSAISDGGGAVGWNAETSDGFAGGIDAVTKDSNGNRIDAIQLGTGTNSTPKSLQVYDYQLMDAEGNIPAERLTNAKGGGLLPQLIVSVSLDSSVVLSNGITTLRLNTVSGIAIFNIPNYGTWTATATVNEQAANEFYETIVSDFVMVDSVKQYALNLTFLPISLEETSWVNVAKASTNGIANELWEIGDEKEISVSGETLTLVIVGFDHDDLTSGGKAGITFGLKNLMADKRQINSNRTNSGGFTGSVIYTWLQNTLLPSLPYELQSVIKTVNKMTATGSSSGTVTDVSMKLFLFSTREITGGSGWDLKENEGNQYNYFATAANRKKFLANGTGEESGWWTRTSRVAVNPHWWYLDSSTASIKYLSANETTGICFGFCI